MLISWSAHVLLAVVAAAPSVETGTVLNFKGQMVAARGDAEESRKSVELTLLVGSARDAGTTIYWTLEERGHGGWAWPDRFGKVELDGKGAVVGAGLPALLYDRGDGKSTVPLFWPMVPGPDGGLAKDATWTEGRLDHRVIGSEKRGDRETWKVEARNAYGVRRTYWVDATSPTVVALRERVFIGQGQEFELRLELTNVKRLEGHELTDTVAGFDRLVNLRDKLGQTAQNMDTDWNNEQLTVLRSEQPTVAKFVRSTVLGAVAKAAEQDIQSQKSRSGAVASLKEKVIGVAAPVLKLEGVGNAGLDRQALEGKVTVLHFWEYRDVPLEEPYGQIGYLDFLYRKRQKEGVQVFGVVVYDNPEDSGARRRAIQGAGRLKSFMNLSYPLLTDDSTALKQFGDPRVTGAKLPLFVVIGPTGKILEYHVGTYEVQRDRGLEDLDKLITKALEKRE